MYRFRNLLAVDWLTNILGELAKSGWKFVYPSNTGTANGQILTPALFHLNLSNGNKLLGSSNYQLTNTGQNNSYNIYADVPNLTTIEWADNSREVQLSGSCIISGCILKFNGGIGSYKIQNNTNAQGRIQNCVVEYSTSTLVFYILTAGFNDNIVLSKLFIAGMSGGVDVFTNALLRDVDFYDTIENDALDHSKLIITESFKINSTNANIKLQALSNCFFDRSCVVIVGSTTYPTIEDAVVANPTWFQNCTIGDVVTVGNIENGENLLPIDSEIYNSISGFEAKTLRPAKASWIINSSSQGTHNGTAWVNGRLQSIAASGYYESEIYAQSSGLKNPTLWLSKGLNYESQTPTANPAQGTPTFMADVKLVGGSYSGTFRAYCWNDPIGMDASGITSGEEFYNPTSIQSWNIESIKTETHVVQGLNTVETGIYGAYLAPSFENNGIKVLDTNNDPVQGAVINYSGGQNTSDVNGLFDLMVMGNEVVEISKEGFKSELVNISSALNYSFNSINLSYSLEVSTINEDNSPYLNTSILLFKDGDLLDQQYSALGLFKFGFDVVGTYQIGSLSSSRRIEFYFDGVNTVHIDFVILGEEKNYRIVGLFNGQKTNWSNELTILR